MRFQRIKQREEEQSYWGRDRLCISLEKETANPPNILGPENSRQEPGGLPK